MPHTVGHEGYAVVSCHVERPLHDEVWERYLSLIARRPSGFRIASLIRPPDPDAREPEALWLERARIAATHGPLGHHTHWTSPTHARPTSGDPAARVRREVDWLRARGVVPRFYCGGGWYMDADVAAAVADAGYADCTATSFRPSYLAAGERRLGLERNGWLRLPDGKRLLELPTTHSLGTALRALGAGVRHMHFHDYELLDRRRSAALRVALRLLARRRQPTDLDALAASVGDDAPETAFADAAE
jgi:hypothetical protein